MKSEDKKGKRGRPRKNPIKIEDPNAVKKKRGRPSKVNVTIRGEENITIKGNKPEIIPVVEEEYIQPKIMRKKRVYRFDKRVFHTFAKKYNGDIVIMSYVIDRLMRMYIDKKVQIPEVNESYYTEWWKGNPPLEPVEMKDITTDNSLLRGIPVQYRYPLLIDEELCTVFEKNCRIYSQYVLNELVKMLLDDKSKIEVDISKYKDWCII